MVITLEGMGDGLSAGDSGDDGDGGDGVEGADLHGELDLWGEFLLCLVQCHALVGRQILCEPPDKQYKHILSEGSDCLKEADELQKSPTLSELTGEVKDDLQT